MTIDPGLWPALEAANAIELLLHLGISRLAEHHVNLTAKSIHVRNIGIPNTCRTFGR
jgi:hypothetical protein